MKTETKIKIGLIVMAVALLAVIVGCTTPVETVAVNPDGSTSTNVTHQVSAKAVSTGESLKLVGEAAPPPYGWIATAAGSLIIGVSQTLANRKNRSRADHVEDIATTIIQGVEAAGTAAQAVKDAIAKRSATDGNKLAVDAYVQKELE